VTFYFDGASAGSDTDANNTRNLIDSGDRLLIGWYSGAVMDDLRALRKGLTSAELGQLYNSGAGTAALDAQQYTWDALNRLREARDPNTGALAAGYLYDADNRRVRKTLAGPLDGCGGGGAVGAGAGGATGPATDYFYDGWRVLEERDGTTTATIRRQFVYGNYLDEALVMDVDTDSDGSCVDSGGSARYFYHQNTLFSVCAVTDSTGKIVEAYEYDPYGRHVLLRDGNSDGRVNFNSTDIRLAMGASAIGNPCTFTGQRFEPETGLHYYKNRYYSSSQGRFISRDPIGYGDSFLLYQYCAGNPIDRTDPEGAWGIDVHCAKTYGWAAWDSGMTWEAALVIAYADQAVDDNWGTGVAPIIGDLGRHMDTTGGSDKGGGSQMVYWNRHREEATGYMKKAGRSHDVKYCKKAAVAFGSGLHSRQDTSSHRPYPYGGGWPWYRVHPTWWDYFGPLPTENANSMGGNSYDDDWWANKAIEGQKYYGKNYDRWRNTTYQVASQKEAMTKVESDTKSAIGGLLDEARKSCVCKDYFIQKE